ncbi:RNA ligase/cyclic nucleotide phosphodiesterase [Aspergillus pseudodeflectus]|uniref:RNA ligase/cyclic nucleotide phosphodiesterase n=1 Tax=Aspergillus pseudodeflectus TaxID=176178 RepID=A0ABR4JPV8_9EURO
MAPGTEGVDNPFHVLISEAQHDPTELQRLYELHRVNRNSQQRGKILSESFPGWSVDTILSRLEGPDKEDGFVDPRNCLVIWARPPPAVREVIRFVQDELKSVAPALWLMPLENLHTTVLEVAHSRTEEEIEALVQTLHSPADVHPSQLASYSVTHPTRLVKPMVSFDSAALALSFVPAAGECSQSQSATNADRYSYHHLRGDIWDLVRRAKIPVASRYVVPSAHVTIARFISQTGFAVGGNENEAVKVDRSQVEKFIDKIAEINRKLEAGYWPRDDAVPAGGEWVVGREGLVIRRGRVWYGGGEDVSLE